MRKRHWTGLVSLFVLGIIWTISIVNQPTASPTRTILASHQWDSGKQIFIYEAVADRSLEISSGYRNRNPLFKTSSWRTLAQGHDFKCHLHFENNRFTRAEIERHWQSLILIAGVTDARGRPTAYDGMSGIHISDKASIEWDSDTGILKSIEATNEEPDWTMEVSDGASGWQRMIGPVTPSRDLAEAFFMLPIFQRTSPELTIRIACEDDSPVLLKVPNPGYKPTFPVWKADPLPLRRDFGDVEVSVEKLSWRYRSSKRIDRVPGLHLKVHRRGAQMPNAWETGPASAEDRFGNQEWSGLFQALPDTKLLRFNYKLERSDLYRWPAEETTELGTGIWDDAEKRVRLDLSKWAENYGIESMTLEKGPDNEEFFPESSEWVILYSGEIEKASRFHDALDNRVLTLILDEDERSTGRTWHLALGTRSSSLKKTDFDLSYKWIGEIEDGQKVRVVLPDRVPPVPFSFTVPLADFSD